MKYIEVNKQMGLKDCFCLIKTLDKKSTRNGKPYLDMVLADATGEVSAKLWDYDEIKHGDLAPSMPVKVRGSEEEFKGAPQFRVSNIRPIVDSDDFDVSELVVSAPEDSKWMLGQIYTVLDAFEDEDLKKIVKYLLQKRGESLLNAPAAVNMHHAERGGLLFHTLSMLRVADRICEVYPFLDRELLLSGVIIHDLGKIDEMEINDLGLATKYTVQGELVGHLVKGAMEVEIAAKELGIDEETALLLEHMVISHHGVPEFGAAKYPSFAEAEVLSVIDNLDATLFEFNTAINAVGIGDFSARQWSLDNRKIFNHGRTFGTPPRADLKEKESGIAGEHNDE
ncbi:MAG: HD domain-containing protein [Clostridia bacterium]|nr:HD domain-containing protein [Clostridia bacterium]